MSKKKKKQSDPVAAEPSPAADKKEEKAGAAQKETDREAGAAQPETPEPTASESPLEQQLLRLRADFDNYRKRTLRERAELQTQALEQIMLELLPVLDHLDLALEAARKHEADMSMVEGFRLVAEQLNGVLRKFGLEPIDADGDAFDHNLHEAISHLPSTDIPDHHVMAQARRGYQLGGRLLRPAQVVVSSGDPSAGISNVPVPDEKPAEKEEC